MNDPINTPDALLSFEQVVSLLRMSPSWVRKATARGELPSLHFGRRVLYDRNEIHAWIAKQRQAPARVLPFTRKESPNG